MTENFNVLFETSKEDFKKAFGFEWSEDYQLYVTYLQTYLVYHNAEIATTELRTLNSILSKQNESANLLNDISRKLS